MSATLKGNILGTGDLEEKIYLAITSIMGCDGSVKKLYQEDPCEVQRDFANRLANAISEGVAKGVQQYLTDSVKTINLPTMVASGPGPHTHTNEKQFDLKAP
jgi:hypothetical protein